MPEALERAFAELALGVEPVPADPVAVRAWLDRSGVSADDAAAILDDGADRLFVYRTLIRATLRDAVACAIPRTMHRLGGVFDEYFTRYLSEVGPRSRYLRDITTELLDFCAPLWPDDPRVPPWAMDLARHEAVQIVVASELARPLGAEPGELDLDTPVRFIDAVRLMSYDHAVHRLSDRLDDRTPPAAEPTRLLVYRSPEHDVRYLQLTPLAAAILERLLAGDALGAALLDATRSTGTELGESVLAGTAALLADLAERGALVGSNRPPERMTT
ncbi:MAG: putative DNA-binding domain-containing protein [Polyangiaceae bacterium]|nr:putative DNA-binding domain-containing protein [Polyangiaceae bacterium]